MYYVDNASKKLTRLQLDQSNIAYQRDPNDVTQWIESTSEILDEPLLIIAKDLRLPIGKKVSLLALDRAANLVIIETKHEDYNGFEWQAIKSVSYFSNLFPEDIFHLYAQYLGVTEEEAQSRADEFVDSDLQLLNQKQRIIMVAPDFPPDLLSSVFYLREHQIEIKCLKLQRFVASDNNAFIVPTWIIPIQELKDHVERMENQLKRIRKVPAAPASVKVEKKDLTESELAEKFIETLQKESDMVPKITAFFEIISADDRTFSKEEVRNELFNRGMGADLGQAAKISESISQHIANRSNGHLRQLLEQVPVAGGNDKAHSYRIRPRYRDLVRQALSRITEPEVNATEAI